MATVNACKTKHLKLFNTCFKNFIRDLASRFPEASEFKVILLSYKVIKTLHTSMIRSMWNDAVAPVRSRLLQHDASIFKDGFELNDAFKCYASWLSRFRELWGFMTENDQVRFWSHVDLLIRLSDDPQLVAEEHA